MAKDYEFYKEVFDSGKYDPDTLIRCLLSSLKYEEDKNEQLENKRTSQGEWYGTGQPFPYKSEDGWS